MPRRRILRAGLAVGVQAYDLLNDTVARDDVDEIVKSVAAGATDIDVIDRKDNTPGDLRGLSKAGE